MTFPCDDILTNLIQHSKDLIDLPEGERDGFFGTGRKGKLKGLIRGELLSLSTCIDTNNEELKHKHKLLTEIKDLKPHKVYNGIKSFCDTNPKRCPVVFRG